jgi:hypothetical protein
MLSCPHWLAAATMLTRVIDGAPHPELPDPGREPPPVQAPAPEPAPPPAPSGWYGGPALVADGLALTIAASGVGGKSAGIFFLGGLGYLLAGPVNHLANHHPGAAAGSVLMRAAFSGLAAVLFVADVASQGCDGDAGPHCDYAAGLFFGALALAAGAIIDDAIIARERPRPAQGARVSWAPGLVVAPNLGLVSVGGAF